MKIFIEMFLIFAQNRDCGYMLEPAEAVVTNDWCITFMHFQDFFTYIEMIHKKISLVYYFILFYIHF